MSNVPSDAHGHEHPKHELSSYAKRIYAIRDLLIEKGVITEKDIQGQIDYQEARAPANGAKLVARAWVDPVFKARFIADQLFRAGARTGANYRSTCRARSRRDFISKMGMVVEESDESLNFVGRPGLNSSAEQQALVSVGRELLAIFARSAKTASSNQRPNHQ